MGKILLIISILSLASSMILFTAHFIKHGFSGSLHFGKLLKIAAICFVIYIISFGSYFFVIL
ncbi:hypothetical protein FHP05_03820 [Cerasibacillus terrae]|uniref:Uncharacterized protein n=1 Tax=Cerasibacillus terrae TaxID=2498845 RepID=A0A5C8NZK8_9BACI|nr:hypothetical protein [Cerasibacillus terrae]TXL66523.1 hypothetical protein FHP05_03820 [Cerasibacillus terrae]